MRILALCSFPALSAATRFRIEQYVTPLREKGIDVEVRPFLSYKQFDQMYRHGSAVGKAVGLAGSVVKRIGDVIAARRYDAVFVQREAMLFGPEVFEWLIATFGRLPMILDLDDATYVRYKSPTYGSVGSLFKFFGKTDRMIRRADKVICGNRFIAEYVESKGTKAYIIPTIANPDVFKPIDVLNDVLTIGWIGTHSTFPSIQSIFPVLEQLAAKHRFRLKLIGTGRDSVTVTGVEVENLPWALDREAYDFASLDIGLYPIAVSSNASEEWLNGKSGFKAIQYMAVGVPFVMSPVGICAEIGVVGQTHLNAESADAWYNSLDKLLSDETYRRQMGTEARRHSLSNYDLTTQVSKLVEVFRSVA